MIRGRETIETEVEGWVGYWCFGRLHTRRRTGMTLPKEVYCLLYKSPFSEDRMIHLHQHRRKSFSWLASPTLPYLREQLDRPANSSWVTYEHECERASQECSEVYPSSQEHFPLLCWLALYEPGMRVSDSEDNALLPYNVSSNGKLLASACCPSRDHDGVCKFSRGQKLQHEGVQSDILLLARQDTVVLLGPTSESVWDYQSMKIRLDRAAELTSQRQLAS